MLRSRVTLATVGFLSTVLRPLADPTVTSQGLRVSLESKEIDLLFLENTGISKPFPYWQCHYA